MERNGQITGCGRDDSINPICTGDLLELICQYVNGGSADIKMPVSVSLFDPSTPDCDPITTSEATVTMVSGSFKDRRLQFHVAVRAKSGEEVIESELAANPENL
jgi:hypothetical protein